MSKLSASLIIALDYHSNPNLTLPSIINQTTNNFETIIVDNGTDSRWELAIKQLGGQKNRIKYYKNSQTSRSSAWNYGVGKSKSPLLIFMGDDFRPNANFIKSHLAAHQKHKKLSSVVIGPAIFGEDIKITRFMHWVEDSGRLFGVPFKEPSKIPNDFFWGANCSMKKKFLLQNNCYDEAFPYHAWDDYELGFRLNRAGMKVYFEPRAIAQHDHKVTLRSRVRAMKQAGESAKIFENKHPGVWPWQQKSTIRKSEYYKIIIKNLAQYMFTKDSEKLYKYYAAVEDAAFTNGYKKASNTSMKF